MKIRIDVVALQHCDVRDRWKEYAAEAVGKQLTLQPQPENVKDPYAVRVREGSLHVGYVAVSDQEAVYQAFRGTKHQKLKGFVVESNQEPTILTVEIEAAEVDWNFCPYDNSPYQSWHYDGISLMPKQLELLDDVAGDLIEELEGGHANRDACLKLTAKLLKSNLYDMSREMTHNRYLIEHLLAHAGDEELRKASVELRLQKGMLMWHKNRLQVARYLFIELPQKLRQKGLERSHYTHDNRLEQLEAQLHAFPFHLYDKFLNDPVDFLREVYYNHVPRRQLFQLLSGIVLMILKGRTTIKQWGREGDTEPIEQIKALGNPQPQKEQTGPLFTPEAMPYWQALQEAGFVDENYKLLPKTSRQQAAYIAEVFAEKLGLQAKFKHFQELWGIRNLAQEKWIRQEKGVNPPRHEEIDEIFEE